MIVGGGWLSNPELFQAFGKLDIIGCYLDLDTFTVSFSKNGRRYL